MINRRKLKEAVSRHTEGFVLAVMIAGILAIAFLVRYRFSFLNFFFLPVILAGVSLGKKKAVLLATLSILLVVLYLVFQEKVFGGIAALSFDDIINLVTWGGFLIVTAGVIGSAAEQKEKKLQDMKRAYTGILSVLMKYLEVADEEETRSVRIARRAGRLAERAGLSRRLVENIKSAALLSEAGELVSSRSLFGDVAAFVELERRTDVVPSGREQALIQTAASLIREIGPLLDGYYLHYVKDADNLDKDLRAIPLGSSLIALAGLVDRLKTQGAARLGKMEIRSLQDLQGLEGRAFGQPAIQALREIDF
jgi:hypothetical protein